MPHKHWVRLSEDVDCGLRRGGWYLAAFVGQSDVVLDLHGKNQFFPRAFFEVSTAGPTRWTIVSGAGNSARIPAQWSKGYGVCPSCRWRQLILGQPRMMLCDGCYEGFEVDWDTVYLKTG
jgi:hypothetical protein